MRNRILKSFSPIHALLFCTSVLLASAAAAGDLEQENSQANGVSISVKPVDVSAANWQFEVALNTHGGSLDDDLTKTATLLAAGRQYPAAGWDGSAAGGHHRKGVLRFKAVSPRPSAIELRIVRPGESAPRAFRWDLK